MRFVPVQLGAFGSLAAATLALADVAPPPELPPPQLAAQDVKTGYKVTEIAKGLDHPWSLAFLPDGSILVTERAGRLRVIKDGALQPKPIIGVPEVHTGSQAGLFDIVLHPKFADNQILYLTYAAGTNAENGTRVARARFDGTALQDFKVIFEAKPSKDTNNHYGARMAFLPDGTFVVTIGDGFEYREKAQDLSSDLGKSIRLNDDGSVPADNPFVGREGVRPEIYTLGHRNEQGLALDLQTGVLWEHEHGPQGGDELNIMRPGRNYGWPVITYALDYTGALVSPFKERKGMEQPVVQWTPSIAPSGLAIYRGDKFPQWNGDALVGALAHKHLQVVDLDEQGKAVGEQRILVERGERIRDVRVSPDGYIYVTTDETDGKVLKLEPAP